MSMPSTLAMSLHGVSAVHCTSAHAKILLFDMTPRVGAHVVGHDAMSRRGVDSLLKPPRVVGPNQR